MKSGQEKFLDYALQMELERRRLPGLSVAVWEKGRIVYAKAFGFANVKTKEKLTPRHRFRIASHSKTFTAVALMRLAKEKKLSLDDPITKHLPFIHKGFYKTTVRQLMNHLGGASRDGVDASFWDCQTDFPDRVQIEHLFTHTGPVLENNTAFKYSNAGYALLGMLIEKVTGEDYRDYMQKHILSTKYDEVYPCYMGDGGPYTHGHTDADIFGNPLPFSIEIGTRAMDAAAGFCATPSGLCAFYADLMNDKVLDRERTKELIRPVSEIAKEDVRYGFGIVSLTIDGDVYHGHSGGFPGQITKTLFCKEKQRVVSCMLNNHAMPVDSLVRLVVGVLNKDCSGIEISHPFLYYSSWGCTMFFKDGRKLFIVCDDESFLDPGRFAEKDKEDRWIIKGDSGFSYNGDVFEIVSKDHIRMAGYNSYTRARFDKEIVPNFKR